jgi:hypothetical protein
MELIFIVDISFRCLAVSRDEKPLFGYSIVLDHLLARWSMAETPEPAEEPVTVGQWVAVTLRPAKSSIRH